MGTLGRQKKTDQWMAVWGATATGVERAYGAAPQQVSGPALAAHLQHGRRVDQPWTASTVPGSHHREVDAAPASPAGVRTRWRSPRIAKAVEARESASADGFSSGGPRPVRPSSANSPRGRAGRPVSARRRQSRKPPLPKEAYPESEQQHIFGRNDCLLRLWARYERSHGGLGNGDAQPMTLIELLRDEQTVGDAVLRWIGSTTGNLHCPACLAEEMCLVKDLSATRRDAAKAEKSFKAQIAKLAEKLADESAEHAAAQAAMAEQILTLEQQLSVTEVARQELQRQLDVSDGRMAMLQKRLSLRSGECDRLGSERAAMQRELDASRAEISQLCDNLKGSSDLTLVKLIQEMGRLVGAGGNPTENERRKSEVAKALLRCCDRSEMHGILGHAFVALGNRLQTAMFADRIPLLKSQEQDLLQLLLRQCGYSAGEVLRSLGSPASAQSLGFLDLKMREFLRAAEQKGCHIGQVLLSLMEDEGIPDIGRALGIDPTAPFAMTFGLARRALKEEGTQTFEGGHQVRPVPRIFSCCHIAIT